MSHKNDPFYWLFNSHRKTPLSAAGKMFKSLDKADKKLEKTGISEELLAALRRTQIISAREDKE